MIKLKDLIKEFADVDYSKYKAALQQLKDKLKTYIDAAKKRTKFSGRWSFSFDEYDNIMKIIIQKNSAQPLEDFANDIMQQTNSDSEIDYTDFDIGTNRATISIKMKDRKYAP